MQLEFERHDLVVQIERETISITSGKVVDKFDVATPQKLARVLEQSNALLRWSKLLPRHQYHILYRITLDIRDREQQAQNWESVFAQYVKRFRLRPASRPPIVILRVSPVRARSSNIPFTLPIRMIEVNAAGRGNIQLALNKVFHNKPLQKYVAALRTTLVNWKSWDSLTLPKDWPTAEVLHFNNVPPFPKGQMLSGDASLPGTLGWLVEKLVTWQVRLLVIRCKAGSELEQMRQFASAILARGGPAVLVEALRSPAKGRHFYDVFYEQLIHDFAIDAMWQLAFFSDPGRDFDASLFVGGGREEQLRPSNIALRLAQFGANRNLARRRITLNKAFVLKAAAKRRPEIHANLEKGLKQINFDWKTSRFEFRERAALLPLSDTLKNLRTNLAGPSAASEFLAISAPAQKKPSSARFVNASFWEDDGAPELRQIDQKKGQFSQDSLYQLGIQIGPKSLTVITVNETALVEEVFNWKPEMKGVWIEIGVSGIDFEVVGDPVQRIWLPAPGIGPTETVYFSVIPRKSGVNRLRFSLYYEQNVIQSFRVGLITGARIKNRRAALTKALDIPPKLSADVAYLPVLEFSLTPSIDDFASRPSHVKRSLAIVANDLNGDSVVTLKNASSFGVKVNKLIPDQVEKLHRELLEISHLDKPNLRYPFTLQNEGNQTDLESALRILAERGAMLFVNLIDSNTWDDIRRELEQPDQTIQVAQILRDKVIPWSFVYGRAIDPRPGDRDKTGKLTNIPVCLAPLPDAQGKLPVNKCGTSPACALKQNQALQPENVVCPLEFWGFKHVVEIPPKQINTQSQTQVKPTAVETTIRVKGNARVVAGVNGSLASEAGHIAALSKLQTKFPIDTFKQQYTFTNLRNELKKSPVHIAYFFCHAEGGATIDSRIVLQDPATNVPDFVLWYQFSQLGGKNKWDPPALVFMNACQSLNFSPEALSPFLQSFVDDLGASGLIGTEIAVWDVFAAEVGRLFLESFLNGDQAGMSLLKARRVLLSKKNPLGLVYTLFAAADLHLE
jgi:hypothetical protein